ncbi:pseudouridine synthase [[Mycoplasma] anseris]|uniref:Pseudouridine synthase n=1 Tax=[Mycoplasma] anseris TaxID=92400 RepID=A0A2Z4NCM0_9BACT|nr:pseudouridine synthase [[Mycoplasma] anseris]AWX69235.1 rRNA pseudouridine synthase [[Mycoplasma] anseris]
MNQETIKIQKAISMSGYCSRREAELLIAQNKVKINNEIAKIGQRITTKDVILIDNKKIDWNKQPNIYLVLNKPKRTICTIEDPENRKTIYQWMNLKEYAFSVGRLDFNTTGIIIITNDGDLANKLAHPSSQIKRSYIATLDRALSTEELKFLNSHRVILDNKKSVQQVEFVGDNSYQITLVEGRNHHVKKLFNLVQSNVIKLHRVSYGCITDKNLKIGKWRNLTAKEIIDLKNQIK